ncbi:MAG: TfpX/TfpZ family type IV pilin accessory protein [Steroidobacteraceae bacterium]
MSRWKASSLYLLMCVIVACTVLACMLLVWFPWPLFKITGGSQLALILVSVDMVLGPLLVLIVYREGKKSLKFDLAVIALLQLSALAYGIYSISLARPVYIVFTVDRFDIVTAKDLDPADLAEVRRPEFQSQPWGRPRYIGVKSPSDPAQREKVMMSSMAGKDLQMFPQYYEPYSALAADALKRARPIASIRPRAPAILDDYLATSRRSEDSVRYLPLRASKQDAAVIVDAKTGDPLKILLVDPW